MNRARYIVTPIFNYFEINDEIVYETSNYKITTTLITLKTNSVFPRFNLIFDYFRVHEPMRSDIPNKIKEKIEDCHDYGLGVPDGFIVSKYDYYVDVEFDINFESLYHNYIIDALVLLGVNLLHTRTYQIEEYKKWNGLVKGDKIYLDLTGQRIGRVINQFSHKLRENTISRIPTKDEILKVINQLIWSNASETVQNVATAHLDLAMDYFFSSFSVNRRKVEYINLMLIIELLFKWSDKEKSPKIIKHFSEFLTDDIARRRVIRKEFSDILYPTRDKIVHGDILSDIKIKEEYSKIYSYSREVILKYLELCYTFKNEIHNINTYEEFVSFINDKNNDLGGTANEQI